MCFSYRKDHLCFKFGGNLSVTGMGGYVSCSFFLGVCGIHIDIVAH